MWPLVVLAVVLAVLVLLAILPFGVRVIYNADGFRLRLMIRPVGLTLYPFPKKLFTWLKRLLEKEKKPKKKPAKKKTAPKKKETKEKEKKEELGGSITDFLPLLKVLIDFFGDLRRKIRIRHLELKLILASSDPYQLAVNYGRGWAAVGSLMPLLEETFVIQKRDVEVECDFTASETRIIAFLDISITLGRIVALGVRYGIRILKEFLKISKTIEGGAENEPKSS